MVNLLTNLGIYQLPPDPPFSTNTKLYFEEKAKLKENIGIEGMVDDLFGHLERKLLVEVFQLGKYEKEKY